MHFATLFDTNIQGHNVCMLELVYIHLSQCVAYVALEVMLSNNGDVMVYNTVERCYFSVPQGYHAPIYPSGPHIYCEKAELGKTLT